MRAGSRRASLADSSQATNSSWYTTRSPVSGGYAKPPPFAARDSWKRTVSQLGVCATSPPPALSADTYPAMGTVTSIDAPAAKARATSARTASPGVLPPPRKESFWCWKSAPAFEAFVSQL